MIRGLLWIAFLTLFFVLEVGEVSVENILIGAVVSAGLVIWMRHFVFREAERTPPLWRRLVWFGPFAVAVLGHVLAGTYRVTSLVLGLDRSITPEVVEVPIGERTRRGVAVTGLVMTLSPGSYLLDVDRDEETMYFHVVGRADAEATRENFQHLYRRYQKRVFP